MDPNKNLANNSADYAEEELTEELTEEEKLFYQMIWGRRWDDVYPGAGSEKG